MPGSSFVNRSPSHAAFCKTERRVPGEHSLWGEDQDQVRMCQQTGLRNDESERAVWSPWLVRPWGTPGVEKMRLGGHFPTWRARHARRAPGVALWLPVECSPWIEKMEARIVWRRLEEFSILAFGRVMLQRTCQGRRLITWLVVIARHCHTRSKRRGWRLFLQQTATTRHTACRVAPTSCTITIGTAFIINDLQSLGRCLRRPRTNEQAPGDGDDRWDCFLSYTFCRIYLPGAHPLLRQARIHQFQACLRLSIGPLLQVHMERAQGLPAQPSSIAETNRHVPSLSLQQSNIIWLNDNGSTFSRWVLPNAGSCIATSCDVDPVFAFHWHRVLLLRLMVGRLQEMLQLE